MLNGTHLLELSPDKLICERPGLFSPLKLKDNPAWAELEAEPDLPYTRDFEKPLGHLTIVLSDSHGNSAHVACDVRHPGDSSFMTWVANPTFPAQLTVNVSLVTSLECEIDREMLQNLWQLVAYYYEYPAILERGQQRGNASGLTYQYSQFKDDNSPYFTDLKGYLEAEPAWLLQPRVTLKLNRQQTSSKKLVMEFATVITKHVNSRVGQEYGKDFTWALIRKRKTGQIKTALEGSKMTLECSLITSDPVVKLEWILPDLSIVEDGNDKIKISEKGQLIILNVTLSDSGLYHCMVRSKTGVDLVPIRLTIKERKLNPTAFNGEKIVVENGQSFSLPCEVKSVQPSLTVWYLPKGQVLLPTQKTMRVEVMENGTLVVHRSIREDTGEYSCLASNLHGVDMLSHMVQVTGEKFSDRTRAQIYREQNNLPSLTQEEGSGGDYQEITNLFATQVPNKSGTQKRKPSVLPKTIPVNGSKRKPNLSIKELNPNSWEEIITSKSMPGLLPTVWSVTQLNKVSLSTNLYESTSATAATTAASSDISTQATTLSTWAESITKLYTAKEKSADGHKNLPESPPLFSQTLLPIATEQTKRDEPGIDTMPNTKGTIETPQPNKTRQNDRINIYNFVPGQTNRWRSPYRRRRPPIRRLRPHVPLLYSKSNNTKPTVLPLPTTKTSTTVISTTTETTITTQAFGTLGNYQTSPSVTYQTEKGESNAESEEHINSELSHNTNKLDKSLIKFHVIGKHSEKLIFSTTQTKVNDMLYPIVSTTKDSDVVNPKMTESSRTEKVTDTTLESEKNEGAVTKTKTTHDHTIEIKSTEKSKVTVATQHNRMGEKTLSTHSNSGSDTQSSVKQNTQMQARTQFLKARIVNTTTEKKGGESHVHENLENKPKPLPKTHISPILQPVHPWLYHSKEGGGQTKPSVRPHSNGDISQEKQYKVIQRVPLLSRWPSEHHHHNFYPLYPTWPGQSFAPHIQHGK